MKIPQHPSVADVLERAVKLVDNDWCQRVNSVTRETGPAYCMMGSVFAAALQLYAGATVCIESIHQLRESLWESLGRPASIADFNDAPDRTKSEVIDVMIRALDKARGL